MSGSFDAATVAALAAEREVRIQAGRAGQRGTIIWVVVVQDRVYARSFHGERGKWYVAAVRDGRAVLSVSGRDIPVTVERVSGPEPLIEAVSRAYLSKYAHSDYAQAMVRPEVLGTTVRLDRG
jgi:hypothetical protein